jgi:acyl-[acyl-carrier-protein]-phospholipid O-acyltransferase/long-chain-fatty-acid--[acyl-carrier-protein] ligase
VTEHHNHSPSPPADARGGRSERGFWHLVALQFQGAFSDNLFRISLILIAGIVLTDSADYRLYSGLIGLLFPLSYLLFSVWAGFIADRFSKREVTLVTKLAEIVLMLMAALAFLSLRDLGNVTGASLIPATCVLFLMFSQSSFFGPSKYGIIAELVDERRLGWANGIIGLTTYLAIILGASLSGDIVEALAPDRLHWIPIMLIALAVAGYAAGVGIDRTAPANPTHPVLTNPLPELMRYFRIIFSDRTMTMVVIGLAYFWAMGAVLLSHVTPWARDSLGLGTIGQSRFFLLLAAGIGVGSALASAFSRRRIEVGLVPLGAVIMAIAAIPLGFASPERRVAMGFFLAMVGIGAGMFSVPLNALLQLRAGDRDRGGVIAADSYVTNVAMVLMMAVYMGLSAVGVSHNAIFILFALATVAATIVIVYLTPDALLRFAALILTRTIYRIRPVGLDRIPESGGVLMISNHVSYIDALLLGSISPRPIRFLAYAEFFNTPLLGFFLRTTRSIPIASTQRPRDMIASMKTASAALAGGEVVCLFAEGQLTRTGQMLPFRRGYELILRDQPAPIVPVYLDGVWGSVFSYERERFLWKRPRQIPYPVRIVFGEPMPADTPASAIRQRILELSAEAALAARPDRRPLQYHLVSNARLHWRRFAMTDALTPAPLGWGRALTGSAIMARRLAAAWGDQENVGVLLPPSVGGALVNFAATLSGRSAINLNYSIGQEALNQCATQSGIRTVVTSRKFLEKVGLEPPAEAIFLEDHRSDPAFATKLAALVAARLLPVPLLMRYCRAVRRPTIDTLATIIFSSGSTGRPKGVPLSQFNVVSNIESFRQAIQLYPSDRLLGTLPFFHSFGYTVSLWGSAMLPFGCVFHLNPLDSKTIGELAEKHRVTLLITTPTFLQQYIRRIAPAQFGGVDCVVTGAERLPDNVAEAFRERFGVEPLQGYGATECSPVVSVNVNDHRSPGFHQVGSKRGSVGHPLPGIAVRTVDPDSGELCGPDQPGLLHVRGANVMSGYVDLPEKTAEVLKDGWYNTGDMATIDEDGFIFITGRLSRFSKIGGEMAPHGTVEDKLHELLGLEEQAMAVTGVPDEKKGEQLVVLHTLDDEALARLVEKLPGCGLPNLFIPRREAFYRIDALPLLGAGKLDLRELNRLAKERAVRTAG